MFPRSITMNIQILFVFFVLSIVFGQDRKITPQLNPGCEIHTKENTLIYVKGVGPHDTLHQIWDFTRGVPTILFAITDSNSSYTISWHGTKPVEFKLDGEPKYVFGASLEELIEFNDMDDRGHIDPNDPQKSVPLRQITWRRNSTTLNDREALVVLQGRFRDDKRGRIQIKLDLLPFQDYAVDLPHLIHTANSTLVDLSFVNLTMSPEYNASRFALRLRMAGRDPNSESMRYNMRKSLDDEHTPGIFEIVELKTPESFYKGDGGFVQFRPVAYTQPARGVASSTIVHVSNFDNSSMSNTMRIFFEGIKPVLVQDMLISFGEAGDGYYTKHNYTSWSFTIGYGSPPVEGFSLFVIMIIAVGLSVPVVLALSGVVYVLVRRYKQRNAPARFIDEE